MNRTIKSVPDENASTEGEPDDESEEMQEDVRKRARGRPRKIRTGRPGRPRKEYVTAQSELQQEESCSNHEEESDALNEHAGLAETEDPMTAREVLESP